MNIFNGKQVIIFDFDGTIADTFYLHETAFKESLKPYSLKFAYKNYLGMSTSEAIQQILKANNIKLKEEEVQELVKTKRFLASQAYHENLKFIPDALAFIKLMHEHQLTLYIASSGSRMNITSGLKALHIDHYFKEVVTSEDVSRSKPDPEIFSTILNRHGITPGDAIVIEDAESGIKAALAAGIDVVCVNPELNTYSEFSGGFQCLSFAELINQFEFYTQHEKSTGSNRYP